MADPRSYVMLCIDIYGDLISSKGAFTLAQFRGRFRTKLAHLEMKKYIFFSKTCKLTAKSRAKFVSVNYPLVRLLLGRPGNTNQRGMLSTIDFLNKVAYI